MCCVSISLSVTLDIEEQLSFDWCTKSGGCLVASPGGCCGCLRFSFAPGRVFSEAQVPVDGGGTALNLGGRPKALCRGAT